MLALVLLAQLLTQGPWDSPVTPPFAPPEWAQPGSGSRAPFINVKAAPFFAVGDGVADDTAAVQAARDALPVGGTLLFPTGNYKVTSTITIAKSITLRLVGATITSTATGSLFSISGQNVGPIAIVGDHGSAEYHSATGKGSVVVNAVNSAASVSIVNSVAVRVAGIAFEGSTSTGPHIAVDGTGGATARVLIEGCTFLGKDNAVKATNTVFQLTVAKNMISAQNAEGVLIDTSAGAGDTSIYIRENWIRATVAAGIKTTGAGGVVNLVIDRNQVSDISANNTSALDLNNYSGATITNNDIEAITGTGTSNGIWLRGSPGAFVQGNTIYDVRGNASIFGSTAYRSFIGPNRILKGSSAATFAIQLDGGGLDNIVTDQHTDYTTQVLNSGATSMVLAGGVVNPINLKISSTTGGGTITLSTGSGTATVYPGARCVCTDTTANASVKCAVSATTLTATGTGSDVIAYLCF